jgi:hypothetical protein
MNVDTIYQLQRDDAFADQFEAGTYQTFVAMPFNNRGGYPEERIRKLLLEDVHVRANELLGASTGQRTFDPLRRVNSDSPSGAVVITDQITTGILTSHFFFGDLTGSNYGVVLETGIALALKPNLRVLLFTQEDPSSLHFDLRVTNVNQYTENTLVENAAKAIVAAARAFEAEADRYIRLLSSQLTSDAHYVLNAYGRQWKSRSHGTKPGIFHRAAQVYSESFKGDIGRVIFNNAVQELSAKRLLWTDYQANIPKDEGDTYGLHATKLGWKVIEHIWAHDPNMRKPLDAPTGPNAVAGAS